MEHKPKANNLGKDKDIFEELRDLSNIKVEVIPSKIFYGELKRILFKFWKFFFVINCILIIITAIFINDDTPASLLWSVFITGIISGVVALFETLVVLSHCNYYVYFKEGVLSNLKHGNEILQRYNNFFRFIIYVYLGVTVTTAVICAYLEPATILFAQFFLGIIITGIVYSTLLNLEIQRLGIPHFIEGLKRAINLNGGNGKRGGNYGGDHNSSSTSSSFNPNAGGDIPKSRNDEMSRRSDDYSAPNNQPNFNNNQNDQFSNPFSSPLSSTRDDFSTSFNPATGLPMTGGGVDINGNPFGVG